MRFHNPWQILPLLLVAGVLTVFAAVAQTNLLLIPSLQSTNAAAAWAELQAANTIPPSPPEWQAAPPTVPEKQKYFLPYVLALADKSKDFYTRFATDTNSLAAKMQEYNVRNIALQWGDTPQAPLIAALEKSLLSDPALSEDERYHLRAADLDRSVQAKSSEGRPAILAQYEQGALALHKEFPNRPEVIQLMMSVARNLNGRQAVPLWQVLSDNSQPAEVRAMASNALTRLDYVGKPLSLQFTAVDGREVDLAKMKGKIVLLDFWATWCPPCLREVPDVVSNYNRFHASGFEIIGVSLDQDKNKLTEFVADHHMAWPQFFDGLYWTNKYARQFKIDSVPTMWLIDKKGVVRDVQVEGGFGDQVEKMLAE